MKTFLILLKTESKLVIRSIDTLFFGVGFPAVVALCIGILMKDSEAFQTSFSAVSTIGICATGLMGLPLTIADYRHRKILKRYSVTPLTPMLILFAQFIINFVISLLSLVVVYFIMNLGFGFQFQGNAFMFMVSFTLISFALYGFGMMIASVSPNIKTANLLCTLAYFPIIFLSGTVIPYDVMPDFIQSIMNFSPLKIGIDLLNSYALQIPMDIIFPVTCLIIIGSITTCISIKCFKWQ